jgi:hypothetical protein
MNTPKEYKAYQAEVERRLEGLTHVSTGACRGCSECGLEDDSEDSDVDSASESHFSWSSCDACGSSLGGDRHPAHGVSQKFGILHLDVCSDCLYYLNYGSLDDTTMDEIAMHKEPAAFKVWLAPEPCESLTRETGFGFPSNHPGRRWQDVFSTEMASKECRGFIEMWRLESGNWTGRCGEVRDSEDNVVGRVRFDGKFVPIPVCVTLS